MPVEGLVLLRNGAIHPNSNLLPRERLLREHVVDHLIHLRRNLVDLLRVASADANDREQEALHSSKCAVLVHSLEPGSGRVTDFHVRIGTGEHLERYDECVVAFSSLKADDLLDFEIVLSGGVLDRAIRLLLFDRRLRISAFGGLSVFLAGKNFCEIRIHVHSLGLGKTKPPSFSESVLLQR